MRGAFGVALYHATIGGFLRRASSVRTLLFLESRGAPQMAAAAQRGRGRSQDQVVDRWEYSFQMPIHTQILFIEICVGFP